MKSVKVSFYAILLAAFGIFAVFYIDSELEKDRIEDLKRKWEQDQVILRIREFRHTFDVDGDGKLSPHEIPPPDYFEKSAVR